MLKTGHPGLAWGLVGESKNSKPNGCFYRLTGAQYARILRLGLVYGDPGQVLVAALEALEERTEEKAA